GPSALVSTLLRRGRSAPGPSRLVHPAAPVPPGAVGASLRDREGHRDPAQAIRPGVVHLGGGDGRTVGRGFRARLVAGGAAVAGGTGENNPRNSVSYGDGVYKSTDGGKTWTNMGLAGSFQIGRIVVHPKDPNIVYVGALGRLYGPNPERGLFKTTNGGQSWEQ